MTFAQRLQAAGLSFLSVKARFSKGELVNAEVLVKDERDEHAVLEWAKKEGLAEVWVTIATDEERREAEFWEKNL